MSLPLSRRTPLGDKSNSPSVERSLGKALSNISETPTEIIDDEPLPPPKADGKWLSISCTTAGTGLTTQDIVWDDSVDRQEITIGSAPTCTVQLDAAPTPISLRIAVPSQAVAQARIHQETVITDLSSTGATLNGVKLEFARQTPLPRSAIITLGDGPTRLTVCARITAPEPHEGGMPSEAIVALRDRWRIGWMLGRGTYGSVFKAVEKSTGVVKAVKSIPIRPLVDAHSAKYAAREVEVLKGIKHPYIVEVTEVLLGKSYAAIVMELVNGGDVIDYLSERCMTEDEGKVLAQHVTSALVYLHSNNIAHRDIKPDNILVRKTEDLVEFLLTDLGLAKAATAGTVLQTRVGTEDYMAPEIALGPNMQAYSSTCDCWSFGMVLCASARRMTL